MFRVNDPPFDLNGVSLLPEWWEPVMEILTRRGDAETAAVEFRHLWMMVGFGVTRWYLSEETGLIPMPYTWH